MHRLRSKSAIQRIRLAALLLAGKCLVTPAVAGVIAYAILIQDGKLATIGAGLLALTGCMVLLQWMIAVRTNCPLCMTPVLGNRKCTKHRSARTFLGSYRLRVALAVLFLNHFRCPYCGEACEVKVRPRGAR